VGWGGGTAIDVAKFCAVSVEREAILVPTLTSTSAPFTDFISVRLAGEAAGMRVLGAPKRVLIDTNLLMRADPRLNRAGYADVLCFGTAYEDWKDAATRGAARPLYEREPLLLQMVESALAAATIVGEAKSAGLAALMAFHQRGALLDGLHPDSPVSAGSEHLFAWVAEAVTKRHFLHGELVALGIVLAEEITGDNRYREALDVAKVQWRPAEIGLSWPEVERTLLAIPEYNERVRHFEARLARTHWAPAELSALRNQVGA
jgi:glycerol dehydrogenase-like iron-containing ADH family enzyme